MLLKDDEIILEEIVSLDGNCMSSKRCKTCPLRARCLPEFLNTVPPSQKQRANLAFDILAHNALIDSNADIESFKDSFR